MLNKLLTIPIFILLESRIIVNPYLYGNVNMVHFNNLDNNLYSVFIDGQESFINSQNNFYTHLSNEVFYQLNDNILSVATIEKAVPDNLIPSYNYYSINIDIKNNKLATTDDLCNKYKIDKRYIDSLILDKLNSELEVFNLIYLENIEINKDNKNYYLDKLANKDSFTLYIKDNSLYAIYNIWDILKLLEIDSYNKLGIDNRPMIILVS